MELKEDIKRLTKEIIKTKNCPGCNATLQNGVCNFCGKESVEQQQLINELNKLLEILEDDCFSNALCEELTDLYQISDLGINKVDEVLSKYNYNEKVLFCFEQLNDNTSLLLESNFKDIDYLVFESFINHKIKDNDKELTRDYLSRILLDGKLDYVSEEDKLNFFCKFAESSSSILGLPKVSARVEKLEENELARVNELGHMILAENFVSAQKLEQCFVTIFHELTHIKQYYEINKNCMSVIRYITLKDLILRKLLKDYYNENYSPKFTGISLEIEAKQDSFTSSKFYFDKIEYNPSKDFYIFSNYSRSLCKSINDTSRMCNDKERDLDDLFEEVVTFLPELLTKYPMLSFEYKIKDGLLVRKKSIEVIKDYENYRLGYIDWNGDKDEICFMYQDTIEKLKKKEKDFSKI